MRNKLLAVFDGEAEIRIGKLLMRLTKLYPDDHDAIRDAAMHLNELFTVEDLLAALAPAIVTKARYLFGRCDGTLAGFLDQIDPSERDYAELVEAANSLDKFNLDGLLAALAPAPSSLDLVLRVLDGADGMDKLNFIEATAKLLTVEEAENLIQAALYIGGEITLDGMREALAVKGDAAIFEKARGLGFAGSSCNLCALKHLGAAYVLSQEVSAYPLHRWLAVGHMVEAERECPLAGVIRAMRVTYMGGGDVDFLFLIGEVAGLGNPEPSNPEVDCVNS